MVLINENNLFICYGTKFFLKRNLCDHKLLIPDLKSSLVPSYVKDDSVFKKNDTINNIKTFIYHGNSNFEFSFTFKDKLNLKYVEIKDSKISSLIRKNFKVYLKEKKKNLNISCDYFSESIETLIINKIEFSMLILGFSNLKYVEIEKFFCDHNFLESLNQIKTTKWKSFVLGNENYYIDKNKSFIFDFLMDNCPDLEAVSVSLNCINHLEKLLNNTKLKHICINLYLEDLLEKSTEKYKDLIKKHEDFIKNKCDLCINTFSVKSLEDFSCLINYLQLSETLRQKNFGLIRRKKIAIISGCIDIKNIKKNSIIDYIENVYVFNFLNNSFKLDLALLQLPETVKAINIFSQKQVNQSILDLLPQKFPYLEQLYVADSNVLIKNFNFVSKFKFLNTIVLGESSIINEDFISLIKKLDYINSINVYSNKKSFKKMRRSLKSLIKEKNLFDTMNVELNGKILAMSKKQNVYLFNLLKNKDLIMEKNFGMF